MEYIFNDATLGTIFGIIGTIVLGYIANEYFSYKRNKRKVEIEEKRIEAKYILKMMENSKNTSEMQNNLLFLTKTKLIRDRDDLIANYAHDNPYLLPAFGGLNSSPSMPTLTVTNITKSPCEGGPIDGCWKLSAVADIGEVVGVHIYYKNSLDIVSEETTLSIRWVSVSNSNEIVFFGGAASISMPRAIGEAHLTLMGKYNIEYIPESAKWYPKLDEVHEADADALFGDSGFNIGDVNPGKQGVLVARFLVVKT